MAPESTLNPAKKAADAKSSAEIVGSIDDLLLEILLRLPLKPLIRSELVSKQWHACITNLSFLRLVISKQKLTPVGFIYLIWPRKSRSLNNAAGYFGLSTDTADKSTTNIPALEKFNHDDRKDLRYEIKQSCNGLLFYSTYLHSIWIYSVCNPTTNRFFTLPEIDGHEQKDLYMKSMCLAFDPAKSPYYEVFCILELSSSDSSSGCSSVNQIYIYSSDTHRWRVSGEPFSKQQLMGFEKGVYWNGSIHWITSEEDFYFDMEDEMLKVMPTRPTKSQPGLNYFGESCDHLQYVHTYCDLQFNVYELKRDYSKWFIKYRVDLSTVVSLPRIEFEWLVPRIFYLSAGEDEKDSFLILGADYNFIQYNLVSKTWKKLYRPEIHRHPEDPIYLRGYMGIREVFQYVESICPVE